MQIEVNLHRPASGPAQRPFARFETVNGTLNMVPRPKRYCRTDRLIMVPSRRRDNRSEVLCGRERVIRMDGSVSAQTTSVWIPGLVGTINYPVSGNIVSGAATMFKVPLTVSNLGNAAVAGPDAAGEINFYLHDTTSALIR